jgi:hypothetical protein
MKGKMESMMKCDEEKCKKVMEEERVKGEIRKMCSEKKLIDKELIKN